MIASGVLALAACQGNERTTASSPTLDLNRARPAHWSANPDERNACQSTKVAPPKDGPQSRELLCVIVSRAWMSVARNAEAEAAVARDSTGLPVRAQVLFSRLRDLSKSEKPARTLVYWQVNFPSRDDTTGISVIVDSLTGETHVFADHAFGKPFHALINPRTP
jgi:hypothetical protein